MSDKKMQFIDFYTILIVLFSILHVCNLKAQNQPVDDVDPQIGSVHGRWFFYTPAALPFGMAKLALHTNAYNSKGSWGPTGYDDRHKSIEDLAIFMNFKLVV